MRGYGASNSMELYDIYLFVACKTPPTLPEGFGPVPPEVMAEPPQTLYVGLPLADARRYLSALKAAGGRGTLAPIAYRQPHLSPDEGMARAQEAFKQQRTPGQSYNQLELVRDEGVYWLYRATRRQPWVDDRVPGTLYLYIDKLDGHVGTNQEVEEWANLSMVTDAD